MEVQIILTIKCDAPSAEAVAKVVHKAIDVPVTERKGLITSFQAIEVRPGSQHVIAFPASLDT